MKKSVKNKMFSQREKTRRNELRMILFFFILMQINEELKHTQMIPRQIGFSDWNECNGIITCVVIYWNKIINLIRCNESMES